MNKTTITIVLAEDDSDDRMLFAEALDELATDIRLSTVTNGVELMSLLNSAPLPSMIFTDVNMPLKGGFECIREIRQDDKLKALPVIVFSTSYDTTIAEKLHGLGATHYFLKPNAFNELKSVIARAINIIINPQTVPVPFVLNA